MKGAYFADAPSALVRLRAGDFEVNLFGNMACVTASYCWMSQLTDLSNLPPCVLACALKAGVSSQSDPGVALLAPIYTCAHDPTKCAAVCAPGTPAKDQ